VVNNNGECIKELIKANADPHIPNKEGKTALKMVEEKSPQLLTFFDKNTNALRGTAPHAGSGP
jgi:ankyrin repeat protein